MDAIRVLAGLAQLERVLGQFYVWLSEVFGDDTELSGWLFRLSLQEAAHASLVDYHRRNARNGQIPDLDVDPRDFDDLQGLISGLYSLDRKPTLREALAVAMCVEGSAAERLHGRMANGVQGELRRTLVFLAREDEGHMEILRKLAAWAELKEPKRPDRQRQILAGGTARQPSAVRL
jgi:rubrerythrin